MAVPLGRTNRVFPRVWLRLEVPSPNLSDQVAELAVAAFGSGAPVDISSSPVLWGGRLAGREDVVVMQVSSPDIERATDSGHAADLVQAHLIQTMSALGRPSVDFYFLRSRTAYREDQISGALETLEYARQEGTVSFLGLFAEGPGEATLANWMLHDAFEVLCYEPGLHDDLVPLAKQRRVGLIRRAGRSTSDETVLVPVRSAAEVGAALHAPVGGSS